MFVADDCNNVGRMCTVQGTERGRTWQVYRAVSGDRYMVRNVATGEFLVVSYRVMSSLW